MGVDIGGTFTDIVLIGDDGSVFSKKVLSTPHDYSEAIEHGVRALLAELNLPATSIHEFAHATTVATNTIIERKGARAALVTTRGFRDVLELGRYRTRERVLARTQRSAALRRDRRASRSATTRVRFPPP